MSDRERKRAYWNHWYHTRADKQKIFRSNKRTMERKRTWLQGLRSTLKCNRCDENHPACLDFHHRDHTEKDFNLGEAIRRGISRQRIVAEMAKCEVLCSNCHRKHHWENPIPSGNGHDKEADDPQMTFWA